MLLIKALVDKFHLTQTVAYYVIDFFLAKIVH